MQVLGYLSGRAAEFDEDTRQVSRHVVLLHLENQQLQKGKGKRQVTQNCGQLLRTLAELPIASFRSRIEPRLTASSRLVLDAQLNFLKQTMEPGPTSK